MLTPEKQGVAKDKDKADTKRLARCGKCINCKSQVRRFIPCTLDSERRDHGIWSGTCARPVACAAFHLSGHSIGSLRRAKPPAFRPPLACL